MNNIDRTALGDYDYNDGMYESLNLYRLDDKFLGDGSVYRGENIDKECIRYTRMVNYYNKYAWTHIQLVNEDYNEDSGRIELRMRHEGRWSGWNWNFSRSYY